MIMIKIIVNSLISIKIQSNLFSIFTKQLQILSKSLTSSATTDVYLQNNLQKMSIVWN